VQAAGGTPLSGQVPAPAEGEPPAEPPRPRRVGLLFGVAALAVVADVITKSIAVAHIREYSRIHVVGSLLMLTLTRNGGAAFNIGGTSMTIVFTAIAAGVIIYILRASRNLRSIGWAITLGLLLGGATGNLVDRIFRAPGPLRGDVVDWIELPHWPVFNLADSSIVCAGFLVVLLALRGIRLDGTRAARDEDFHATNSHATDPHATDSHPTGPHPTGPHATGPQVTGPQAAGSSRPDTSEPGYPKPDYPEPQSRAAQSP
jgi:signal peptidase II